MKFSLVILLYFSWQFSVAQDLTDTVYYENGQLQKECILGSDSLWHCKELYPDGKEMEIYQLRLDNQWIYGDVIGFYHSGDTMIKLKMDSIGLSGKFEHFQDSTSYKRIAFFKDNRLIGKIKYLSVDSIYYANNSNTWSEEDVYAFQGFDLVKYSKLEYSYSYPLDAQWYVKKVFVFLN